MPRLEANFFTVRTMHGKSQMFEASSEKPKWYVLCVSVEHRLYIFCSIQIWRIFFHVPKTPGIGSSVPTFLAFQAHE